MWFKRLWEDYKAYMRHESRVAPKNVRGRVYARNAPAPIEGTRFGAQPIATLEMKITRADGSTEVITQNAEVIRNG